MAKDSTVSVKAGATEYEQLKTLARSRGQFLTFVLNQAIRDYLAAQPKAKKA